MGDPWERAMAMAEQHAATGGLFVRLQGDGDSVRGVFLGDPLGRELHWVDGRYVNCPGKQACEHCGDGVKTTIRVAMNFYSLDEKALKVIEGGTTWFKDVVRCRTKYGLSTRSFEVQRNGASGDPRTSYAILPDENLTPEQQRMLAALPLHDLKAILIEGAVDDHDNADQRGRPIDAKTADQIVGRLKTAPSDVVRSFLKKFGIDRVRELKASDERAAFAFLDATAPIGDVDPFA